MNKQLFEAIEDLIDAKITLALTAFDGDHITVEMHSRVDKARSDVLQYCSTNTDTGRPAKDTAEELKYQPIYRDLVLKVLQLVGEYSDEQWKTTCVVEHACQLLTGNKGELAHPAYCGYSNLAMLDMLIKHGCTTGAEQDFNWLSEVWQGQSLGSPMASTILRANRQHPELSAS